MQTSEPKRQFYLAMLGVHSWYARQPLPGAAPSPEFVFPVVPTATPPALRGHTASVSPSVKSPDKARPARQSDPAAAARIADLRSLMLPEKVRAAPAERDPEPITDVVPGPASISAPVVAAEASPVTLSQPTAKTLDVNLTVWRGAHVSLVAALSSDASAKLQHSLANNILRSVGESVMSEGVSVRWPVFNNLLVRGNQPQDLVGVLRPLVSFLKGQRIIVLGISESVQHDQLAVNVTDNVENPEPSHDDGAVTAVLPDWLTEALPQLASSPLALRFSLAELAAQPVYKRQLWLAIKSWLV